MVDFMERMGSAVCHQMAERSFIFEGMQMPLCARCTGIYIGAFFAFCFFLLKKRLGGNKPFSAQQSILMVCCIVPMAADGFGSYAGLWESSQFLRILTGGLIGAVVPGFFLLAGNFEPTGENEAAIYENTMEMAFLPLISAAFGLFLWAGLPLQGVGAVFSILGQVCLWAGVPYLVLKNIFGKKNLPFWGISLLIAFVVLFTVGGLVP